MEESQKTLFPCFGKVFISRSVLNSSIYILLIISFRKYEEICAPRVEEFCFITDNTYKKEEVPHFSLK